MKKLRGAFPWIAPALAAGALGCGGAEGLYPVEGRVVHKGEPAAGAVIWLVPQGPIEPAGVVPRAEVRDDGWFRVESGDLGRGAPAGSYAVLVEWRQGPLRTHRLDAKTDVARKAAREAKPLLMADDRLNGKYADPARPRVVARVEPRSNSLPTIELVD